MVAEGRIQLYKQYEDHGIAESQSKRNRYESASLLWSIIIPSLWVIVDDCFIADSNSTTLFVLWSKMYPWVYFAVFAVILGALIYKKAHYTKVYNLLISKESFKQIGTELNEKEIASLRQALLCQTALTANLCNDISAGRCSIDRGSKLYL
jgi:hypothetical protein